MSEGEAATRTIFHVDMDAFYASIEQRDQPQYRGKPVIVGADPRGGAGRGVVAACSYEARRFRIHSALPISQAFRLCPHGVFLRPDMPKYARVSREIRKIFRSVTDLVEPISIDEAFLDVSDKVASPREALTLAKGLKSRIRREQELSASVGIAPNKFLAKIASDFRKPNGLFLVRPQEIQRFLDPLPISRIWGVGPRTEEKLKKLNIHTIGQLRQHEKSSLLRKFGKHGEHLWELSNGIDNRPIVTQRKPKSIGHEHTFSEDIGEEERIVGTLNRMSRKVTDRLHRHQALGSTVCLKLRYSDFTTITRQSRLNSPVAEAEEIAEIARRLLLDNWDRNQKVRLVGVSVSGLRDEKEVRQMRLF
jgi:nucleotidyltransferase/DNA polymerase involved in DNA repair